MLDLADLVAADELAVGVDGVGQPAGLVGVDEAADVLDGLVRVEVDGGEVRTLVGHERPRPTGTKTR